jgi:hypothetical protein
LEEPRDRFDTGLAEEAAEERSRRLSHELALKLIRAEDQERQKRFSELMELGIASRLTEF